MLEAVSSAEAKSKFSELMGRAAYGKERIIIKRKGKPIAALISIEDLIHLEEMEEKVDIQLLKEAIESPGEMIPISKVIEDYERTHNLKLSIEEGKDVQD